MEQLSKYAEKLRKHTKLKFLFFELTDACNLCCAQCGSRDLPECRKMLTYARVCHVFDRVAQVYQPHRIVIYLTGGEPLLRKTPRGRRFNSG